MAAGHYGESLILARLQVRVSIRRLLERLGPFHIPDGAEVTYFSPAGTWPRLGRQRRV